MSVFIGIVEFIISVVFIILVGVQTEKSDQGGVMGIGAAGGQTSSDIDMEVGIDRILKPLTRWLGIGLVFICILGAIKNITIYHVVVALVMYLFVMMYGSNIWSSVMRTKR